MPDSWDRREVLRGGLAVAATPLLGAHPAPTPEAEVSRLVDSYFRDKNAADPDATMAHFSRTTFAYLDATLGLEFPTWTSLRDFFRQLMPTWTPQVRSYPVRILGDAT